MSIGPWTFTGFDIVVLLVILVSLMMAAGRGFFRELISIAALIIASNVNMNSNINFNNNIITYTCRR